MDNYAAAGRITQMAENDPQFATAMTYGRTFEITLSDSTGAAITIMGRVESVVVK